MDCVVVSKLRHEQKVRPISLMINIIPKLDYKLGFMIKNDIFKKAMILKNMIKTYIFFHSILKYVYNLKYVNIFNFKYDSMIFMYYIFQV